MSITQHPRARQRMTWRRVVQLAAGGAAAALVLAGCAGGAQTEPTGAAATPVSGGTLTMANAGVAHETLDAMKGILRAEAIHSQLVYNTLTTIGDDFVVTPVLAESMTPNADASEWTVTLREGVTFSDGKPLTSDDVIFSINRMVDPEVLSSAAAAFSAPLPTLTSLDKIDDRTLVIKLSGPNTVLDSLLTMPQASIYPTTWTPENPIGTGPFTLKSLEMGSQAVFEKNPTYFAGPAYLDEVVSIEIPDSTARLNALYAGQIDVALQTSESQVAAVEQAGFDVLRNEAGTYPLITMNSETGPFTDPRVRKALQLAVDRDLIKQNVYGGHGQAGNDVPGVMDPEFDTSLVRERNVEEARKLIQEAGVTEPITTVFRARDAVLAQTIEQSVAEAGITLDLQQVPDAQYSSSQYLGLPLRFDSSPAFTFIYNSITFDTPGAYTWYSKWTDQEYLDLQAKYLAEPNAEARKELAHQMQAILFDRGPYLLTVFPDSLVAYAPQVHGLPTSDPFGFGLSGQAMAKVYLAP